MNEFIQIVLGDIICVLPTMEKAKKLGVSLWILRERSVRKGNEIAIV